MKDHLPCVYEALGSLPDTPQKYILIMCESLWGVTLNFGTTV